jgi:hypothetical protein
MFESFAASLRAASFGGLVLAALTLLFGQGMGIVLGLNEDAIKGRLAKASALLHALGHRPHSTCRFGGIETGDIRGSLKQTCIQARNNAHL